jgi:hypothetical protein
MLQNANKLFFTMVCGFLAARNYSEPSWEEWLDIRGTALGDNKRIDAIKMLRRSCERETIVEVEVPKGVSHPDCEFSVFVREQGRKTGVEYLSLLEAKCIIDWLCSNENVFGRPDEPVTLGELFERGLRA